MIAVSEWIDVLVYAALIVAVWGWLPGWSSRLMIPLIADRNPDWMAGHPEFARQLARAVWLRWSCLVWGALSVATLSAFRLGVWPQQLAFVHDIPKWEALRDINSVVLIIGLVYVAGCSVVFQRWLSTNVPRATHRQAVLERRSIDNYVPRPLQHAVYSVVVLHLATWVAVGVIGRYATPAFWGGMAFQFVISAIFLVFVVGAVWRRPGVLDRIYGPRYRQTEVRVAFAAQLLPLLNGGARLYEHVAGAPLDDVDRVLHLALVLFVLALTVALAVWFRSPGERWPGWWSRSATRAAARAATSER